MEPVGELSDRLSLVQHGQRDIAADIVFQNPKRAGVDPP
jgi:hypothetical protein